MHNILVKKKLAKRAQAKRENATRMENKREAQAATTDAAKSAPATSLLSKKPKGRPATPDLVNDANGDSKQDRLTIMAACTMLQKLIRGRAIQNTMHEGRLRRKELIAELRQVDTLYAGKGDDDISVAEAERQQVRAAKIRQTTIDAIVGGQASNVMATLAQEHVSSIYLLVYIVCHIWYIYIVL